MTLEERAEQAERERDRLIEAMKDIAKNPCCATCAAYRAESALLSFRATAR